MIADGREFRDCQRCLCSGLRRAARLVTQHYDRHLRPAGLRVTQFTLLAMLAQTGPLPIGRLASGLGLERTTLTRNLGPLEAKGWVAIKEEQDRRVHSVAITSKGRAAARAAQPFWRKAQATAGAKVAALRLGELLGL